MSLAKAKVLSVTLFETFVSSFGMKFEDESPVATLFAMCRELLRRKSREVNPEIAELRSQLDSCDHCNAIKAKLSEIIKRESESTDDAGNVLFPEIPTNELNAKAKELADSLTENPFAFAIFARYAKLRAEISPRERKASK